MAEIKYIKWDHTPLDERLSKLNSGIVDLSLISLEEFQKSGNRIISLEENALLRMYPNRRDLKYHYINEEGNQTRECFVYVPDKGIFLTKHEDFPLLEIEVIKNEYNNGSEIGSERFFINHSLFDNPLKKVLKDSIKVEEKEISTNTFGKDEITDYVFGTIAKDYGDFLREKGIETMRIGTPKYELGRKPFVQLVWFANVNGNGKSQIVPSEIHRMLRVVKN